MKRHGLDSSLGGRKDYATKYGIAGVPGSELWNDKIRRDVIQRFGP